MLKAIKPMDIEKCSFEIITRELGDRLLDPENELVVKRVIHTTADFDYVENLRFSAHAVGKGIAALRGGCDIVTDTQMARSGINKTILAQLGGESLQNQPVEGHLQRHPVPEVRGGGGLAVQIDGGVRRQGQAIDAFPVVSVIPAAGERGVQLRQQQDSILRAVYNPAGEIGGGLILRQGGDRAGAAAALRRLTGRGGCGIAAAGQSGIFAGRRAAGGKKRQAQDERQEILFHGTALLCLFSRREGAFGSAGRENIFFAFPGRGRCPLRGKE